MASKFDPHQHDHIEADAKERVFGRRSVRFTDLQNRVQKVVKQASWWDRYGEDRAMLLATYLIVAPAGFLLAGNPHPVWYTLGLACLGFCHHAGMVKGAHLLGHNALGFSEPVNDVLKWFVAELVGAFPADIAIDAHVKIHHPHTNIIGLGDSSTWKVSFVPAYSYMFLLPLTLPVVTPLIGIQQLCSERKFSRIPRFAASSLLGFVIQYWLFREVSMLSPGTAMVSCVASRAMFMIPYIHVNIFQHIGLSMYSKENRPDRLSQMAYGALNLPRHPILDFNFGHSIINCHVEHHLFPTLSDKLCLRIKPTVQKFFEENGLPYFEKTYANRLNLFVSSYKELMVNAPPITSFVAVQ